MQLAVQVCCLQDWRSEEKTLEQRSLSSVEANILLEIGMGYQCHDLYQLSEPSGEREEVYCPGSGEGRF